MMAKAKRPTEQELREQRRQAKYLKRMRAQLADSLTARNRERVEGFRFPPGGMKMPVVGVQYVDVPGRVFTARMASAEHKRQDDYARGREVPGYYEMLWDVYRGK